MTYTADYRYHDENGDLYVVNTRTDFAAVAGLSPAQPGDVPLSTGVQPRYVLARSAPHGIDCYFPMIVDSTDDFNTFINTTVTLSGVDWQFIAFCGENRNVNYFQGPPGPTGATGPQGPQGATGAAGSNGANGTNGTNGTPNWKGSWSNSTAYVIGDAVSLSGSSYVCNQAHTNHTPPNASYWDVLASKGDTGATGAQGSQGATGAAGANGTNGTNGTPNWKGAWSSATAYIVGDAVSLNGSSYVCNQAHTNHTPPNSSYWDVLASKGDAGISGSPATNNYSSNFAANDVTIGTQNTYGDAGSVSLTAGTYLILAYCEVTASNQNDQIAFKIWDGTSSFTISESNVNANAGLASTTLICTHTLASTTTVKMSATNVTRSDANCKIKGSSRSGIVAVQIA